MKVLGMGYVGFRSPNSEAWRSYGPEVLAMTLSADGADGAVRLRMDERNHRIAIHPGEQEELAYIGWELANRDCFENALDELADKNVAFTPATEAELLDRRVLGMVSMLDPSGFRHEIFWGQNVPKEPFWPARYHQGYVGDALGNPGHLVLMAPEVTKDHARFAMDILGFHPITYLVMGGPDGKAVPVEVYRCNERSHCLIWMPFPGHKGLSHMHIEVKHVQDLFRTYEIAKRDGHPISMDLGQFVPDTDISFYLRTPSGWDLQVGWDTHFGRDNSRPNATSYDARGGQSVAWGHQPLLPLLNSSIRPVDGAATPVATPPAQGEKIDWTKGASG